MIQPINNNLLLKIEKVEEINGIILPEDRNDINEKAKVLAVGEDVKKIKKGDTVYFKSWALDTVVPNQQEDTKVTFIKEEFILAHET